MTIESLNKPNRLDEDRIKLLEENFPEAIIDGKLDFSVLKEELKNSEENILEYEGDSYGLRWPGKREARMLSTLPPKGTLEYRGEEGVNSDETKNYLIEGDNLDVLRVLRKSYKEKLKLIMIDPPYNTSNDFIYNDDYKDSVERYLQLTGQADEEGLLTANPKSSGRFHANWLNMMYPRLRIARDLLRKDGLIMVHIDENEEVNLEMIMNEIFHERNKLGKIIWNKRNPKGDSIGIATQHETILVYAKDKNSLANTQDIVRPKKNAEKMLRKAEELFNKIGEVTLPSDLLGIVKKYGFKESDFKRYLQEYDLEAVNKEFKQWVASQNDLSGGEAAYNNIDSDGNVYRPVSMAWPNKKKAPDEYFIPLIHPKTKKECPVPNRGWRNPPKTMERLQKENKILFGKDEKTIPNRKYLLKENMNENIPSILNYGASDDIYFNKIDLSFDNPKPYKFIAELISYFTTDDDIIMDFFAGSGTTGHSVLEANKNDGGRRSFILVQLPEKVEEGMTIVDVTKARLSKSIELMNNDDENNANQDRGFAVYSLSRTNLKKWTDYEEVDVEDLERTVDLFNQSSFMDGYTEYNVVIELMLNQGYPLDSQIKIITSNSNKLWLVENGNEALPLVICLDEHLEDKTVGFISDKYPDSTFICLDNSLSDRDKILISESNNVKTI